MSKNVTFWILVLSLVNLAACIDTEVSSEKVETPKTDITTSESKISDSEKSPPKDEVVSVTPITDPTVDKTKDSPEDKPIVVTTEDPVKSPETVGKSTETKPVDKNDISQILMPKPHDSAEETFKLAPPITAIVDSKSDVKKTIPLVPSDELKKDEAGPSSLSQGLSNLFSEATTDNFGNHETSQLKEIENSIFEETSEFKSANVIRDSPTIELKKIYTISGNWMSFTMDKDYSSKDNKFHLLIVKGSGTLIIKTTKADKSHEKTVTIELDSTYEMSYIPVNSFYYLSKKGDSIQIKVEKGLMGIFDTPELKIDFVTHIEMEFNQNHRIDTKLSQKVKYRIVRPDLHTNKEGKDDRLQFILQSSLNEQDLEGNEEISMYINKKEYFPTRSNYDFMATGNMGYGLVKSLHKGNQNYCITKGCQYNVTIYTKNVDSLFFFPTVFANFSKLEFHKYLYLLEELEGKEQVSYELSVPKHDGDWVFRIQPIEGHPRIYINPDEIPNSLKESKYKSYSQQAEEITITSQQAKQYGFTFKKFFVTFEGDNEGYGVNSFKFEVFKVDASKEAKNLNMDYAQTGFVANKEILEYNLKFEVDQPEVINFELKMKSIIGRSILVLKECEDGTICKVTHHDVKYCKNQILKTDTIGERLLQNQPYAQGLINNIPQDQLNIVRPNQSNDASLNQPQYGANTSQPQYVDPTQMQYVNPNQMQYVNPNQIQYADPNQNQNQDQNRYMNPNLNRNIPRFQQNQRPIYDQREGFTPLNIPIVSQTNDFNPLPPMNQYQDYNDQNGFMDSQYGNMPNQEMISEGDIQQAEQDYIQEENDAVPNMTELTDDTDPYNNWDQDNKPNVIPVNSIQNNLTILDTQKMEALISDPFLREKGLKRADKDEQMNQNKDYTDLKRRQDQYNGTLDQYNNPEDSTTDPNQPENNNSNYDQMSPSFDDQQTAPTGFKYNLEEKVDGTKIKCTEGQGEYGSYEESKLYLNFNCLGEDGSNQGVSFEELNDDFPYSTDCRFAVGIYGSNYKNAKFDGTSFSVMGQGGVSHKDVLFKISKEFIVEDFDLKYLRFDTSKYSPGPGYKLQVKVVAITGSCNIYVSKDNKYPDKNDNEANLIFRNDNFMSVRTSEKIATVDFEDWGAYASLFVTIQSEEYCVVDIYAQKLNGDGKSSDSNEILSLGKMVKRKITKENFVERLSDSTKHIFAREFFFRDQENNGDHLSKGTKVTVNSNVIGLKICLQKNKKQFVAESPCDIESESGVAEIPAIFYLLEPDQQWAMAIIYEQDKKDEKSFQFPIEFSVMVYSGSDAKENLQILDPGRIFESHINKTESMIFKINLLYIDEKSLIILTSEDKSVKGEISMSKFDFANPKFTLDSENFALEINHMEQDVLCDLEDPNNCIFYIRVSSTGDSNARFSLTYTVDDIPITLKEGHELFIPNRAPMYFIYDPNSLFPAEFNLESDYTDYLIYAKIVNLPEMKNNNLKDVLSEFIYDYKTDIGKLEQLRIPQKQIFEAGENAVIAYLVAPKFKRLETDDLSILYSSAATTRVHVKSKMSKLDGFVHGKAVLTKGEFRHFYFNVDNEEDFSLVMTTQSGKANLYLNKGLFNLPTLKDYWKKKTNGQGEELVITKEMFKNKPQDIKGVYTAGIYAKTNCRVSVVFLPSFKNLIKIKHQQLVHMKLRKNQDYYFEFFNNNPSWDMDLYAENSDIEVSIMDYSLQKDSDADLIEILQDDKRYIEHLKFVKGSLPLKHREENAKKKMHYVLRVRAVSSEALLNLMIYDIKLPLLIPAKKKMTFVGNKGETYIFKTELINDFEEISLKMRLYFGNIEFQFSDNISELDKSKVHKLSLPIAKKIKWKPKSKKEDINLFSEFFIKIKFLEFSKTEWIIRGNDKFVEIKEFETEIFHTSPTEEQNIYFYLSKKKTKEYESLIFDINMVNFYSKKPKFLFNPDGEEIELETETKFLPMPLQDISDRVSGEFRHIEVRTEVEGGYYIIQIPKNEHILPLKISVSSNDTRSLEPNGVYRYNLPRSTTDAQKFSMYLPEKGEFRILLESCQNINIEHASLHLFQEAKPIIFEDNLVQASHFVKFDDRDPKHSSRVFKDYITKVFRGVNEESGVLEFKIENSKKADDLKLKSMNKDYLMLTEFKPVNRDLFFKDYVDLWGKSATEHSNQYSYKWDKKQENLQVEIFTPRFREQLLIDFPNTQKIVIKFFVTLFSDPTFMDRLDACGLSAVDEIPHEKLFHTESIVVPKDFNKQKPLIFQFTEEHLRKYRKSDDISVFTYMSITFFENELEEFEVGYEMKFANVPYFLLITQNKFGRAGFSIWKWILIIMVILVIGFMIWFKQQNEVNENDVRNKVSTNNNSNQYTNPNVQNNSDSGFISLGNEQNQIQMNNL